MLNCIYPSLYKIKNKVCFYFIYVYYPYFDYCNENVSNLVSICTCGIDLWIYLQGKKDEIGKRN